MPWRERLRLYVRKENWPIGMVITMGFVLYIRQLIGLLGDIEFLIEQRDRLVWIADAAIWVNSTVLDHPAFPGALILIGFLGLILRTKRPISASEKAEAEYQASQPQFVMCCGIRWNWLNYRDAHGDPMVRAQCPEHPYIELMIVDDLKHTRRPRRDDYISHRLREEMLHCVEGPHDLEFNEGCATRNFGNVMDYAEQMMAAKLKREGLD